jgi:tetratricopeptide (TPR) repeat protein
MGDMADLQSLEALRERAFGVDIDALDELLSGFSQAELKEPTLLEVQGVAKYRKGDIPAAVSLISRAADSPKHVAHLKSLLFLMRGQYLAGDADGALLTARRVIDAEPANQEALKLAGRLYNQRQDWDHADRFWRQLCEVAPQEPEAALQVARIGGRRGEWETQAFFADILLRVSPEHPEGLRLAIDGRIRSQRLEGLELLVAPLYRVEPERARAFLRSLGRPEQAETLAAVLARLKIDRPDDEALWRLAEDQADTWLDLALRHEVVRKDDLAAMLFRAAREANPAADAAVAGIQRLSQQGVAGMREALRARDEPGALRHAQRVVEIDPQMAEAWLAMGRLTLASDPACAASHLSHAGKLAPDDTWVQLNLGRAMEKAERYIEAIGAYSAVIRLTAEPTNERRAEAAKSIVSSRQKLIRQGRDAYREGRLDDAWRLYTGAASDSEMSPDLETMFGQLKRGMFVDLREKFKAEDPDFIAEAEKYLSRDPDHAEALRYLGRRLMPARQHERARQVWTRLAALDPEDAHYQLQIARCCSKLKLNNEGEAAAREALRLEPNLTEAAALLQQFAPS